MSPLNHSQTAHRLLRQAVETYEGQPADTNIARAQVYATLAVADALEKIAERLAGSAASEEADQ